MKFDLHRPGRTLSVIAPALALLTGGVALAAPATASAAASISISTPTAQWLPGVDIQIDSVVQSESSFAYFDIQAYRGDVVCPTTSSASYAMNPVTSTSVYATSPAPQAARSMFRVGTTAGEPRLTICARQGSVDGGPTSRVLLTVEPERAALVMPGEVTNTQRIESTIAGVHHSGSVTNFVGYAQATPCAAVSPFPERDVSYAFLLTSVAPVYSREATVNALRPGQYELCVYERSAAIQRLVAGKSFRVVADPSLFPRLLTPNGVVQKDRAPDLVWTQPATASYPGPTDRIDVFRGKPGDERTPIVTNAEPGGTHKYLGGVTVAGKSNVLTLKSVGFGSFWWRIKRTEPDDDEAREGTYTSDVRTFRVVPRGVTKRASKVAVSSIRKPTYRREGRAQIRVTSAPKTRVVLSVFRGRKRVLRRAYTEQSVTASRAFAFSVSCAKAGKYRATAVMRDAFGRKLTARKTFTVPKGQCTKPKPRPARRRSGDSGGSGGGGSSYGGLNCSEIGHDFYVVPGSDPEHDADNDGHACEAYA